MSRHPLELFRPRIERLALRYGLGQLVASVDIAEHRGHSVWTAGILVTGKEVCTRKREPMIFVSFEDEHAVFETVLFPDAFNRFYALLDDGWAFLVHGRVEDDLGAVAITVERLVMVSRRGGEAASAEASAAFPAAGVPAAGVPVAAVPVVSPQRPPMMLWGRYDDYEDDPVAADIAGRAAGRIPAP